MMAWGIPTNQLASNLLLHKFFPSTKLLVVDPLVSVAEPVLPALHVAGSLLLQRLLIVPLVAPPTRVLRVKLQHLICQLQGSSDVARHAGREGKIFEDVRPGNSL